MSSPCMRYQAEGRQNIIVHNFEDVSDPYQEVPSENLLGTIVQCWGANVMCRRCNETSWRLVQEDEKYAIKETEEDK